MNYTVGDGMAAIALVGGIVSYFYLTHRTRLKKIEIIHQERMAAMDKGIPLPEFPFEPAGERHEHDPQVLPILGIVLLTLSLGAMILLYVLPHTPERFWVSPLPFVFLGVGLIAFHFLQRDSGR